MLRARDPPDPRGMASYLEMLLLCSADISQTRTHTGTRLYLHFPCVLSCARQRLAPPNPRGMASY